ncbi:MAG: hypothetical protein KF901_21695 [Myxococcales bacterium]|nr:hypothetical protein [Myxococcales bacterium]
MLDLASRDDDQHVGSASPRFDWRADFGPAERAAADAELFVLARGLGRVRLQVGLALVALGRDHRELGFRSLATYARQQLSRSKGWAGESRAVASRLLELPRMLATFWEGRLSWSMVALLSRFATAEDEVELLEATAGMTVRGAREVLRERGHDPDEPEERFVTLRLSMPLEDAAWLERGRWLLQGVEGVGAREWFELLLAEGDTSLLEVMRDVPGWHNMPEDVVEEQARWHAAQARGREEQGRREEVAAARLASPPTEAGDAPELPSLPHSPRAIDAVLRALAATLDARELYFGELAERVFHRRGWAALEYASEEQYCRERLGLSAGLVRSRIRLAREARRLPVLGDALRDGKLGLEAALLVARVASRTTAHAWVKRAQQRTYENLREEVQAAELTMRLTGSKRAPLPPDRESLEAAWKVERDTLSGASLQALIGRMACAPHRDAVAAVMEGVERARRAAVEDPPTPPPTPALEGVDPSLRRNGGQILPQNPHSDQMSDHFSRPPQAVSGRVSGTISGPALARPALARPAASTFAAPDVAATEESLESPVLGTAPADVAKNTSVSPQNHASDRMSDHFAGAHESRRRVGFATVEIRCREDAALHYRQLEASYERAGLPGSFLRFAVTALCHVMLPLVATGGGKYRDVHLRDRLRCSSPVCDSRNVTCHHVVFRAHQGGEELENLTSPCEFCHLEGLHGGRLRVHGRAPDLTWEIGREPVLVVEGRELRRSQA